MFDNVCIKNLSVSLNLTFVRNKKVKHYIKIKIYKFITSKFWVKSDINDYLIFI